MSRCPRCLLPIVALLVPLSCTADEVRDATVSRLAVGTWRCTIDSDAADYPPLEIRIDGNGTFGVAFQQAGESSEPGSEISGTWTLDHGDLDWRLDVPVGSTRFLVPDFDALTPDSSGFTLQEGGLLDATFDRGGRAGPTHAIEVDAHGTDSVTFREHGGDPWTCHRQ
ncbi:MAG: hypothetical protein KF703_17895 [Actinobacteria bacterium]|nr:hypothetical protein [Actinomycetota bacterium]